jgi:excisionase family DNA binding protein
MELLSVEEAANALEVTPRTILNYIYRGTLSAGRFGRKAYTIERSEVERYLEQKNDNHTGNQRQLERQASSDISATTVGTEPKPTAAGTPSAASDGSGTDKRGDGVDTNAGS